MKENMMHTWDRNFSFVGHCIDFAGLATYDYITSSATYAPSNTTTKLIPIILTWANHDFTSDKPDENLDTEVNKLTRFFRQYMHVIPHHYQIPNAGPNNWALEIQVPLEMTRLREKAIFSPGFCFESTIFVVVYSGHGHVDSTTKRWILDSG
jgi:hypothetical protein